MQITHSAQETQAFLREHGLKTAKVESVQSTGVKPVFDVSLLTDDVPVPKSIVTNGIVTHNSTEVVYTESIMKAQGIKIPVEEVFGIRDPQTNRYVVKPRVRLYFESVAERFFDYLAKLERMLPDKVKIGDSYYYVYPHTKENVSALKGEFDSGFLRQHNKLRVPAPDGLPQAFLVVDSYPAMLPEGQDVDDPSAAMAIQARMFSDQMKRVKGKMRAKRITVVGMNQLRERPATLWGSPVYEPCGQAIRFYCMAADTLLFTSAGIIQADACDATKLVFGKEYPERPNLFGKIDDKRVITVSTEHGYTVRVARSHQFWATWNTVGTTGWFSAERVSYGDYKLQVVGGQNLWGTTVLDLELAAKIGEHYRLSMEQAALKLGISEARAEELGFSRSGSNRDLFALMATMAKDVVLAFLGGLFKNGDRPVFVLERQRHYLRMMLLNLGVHTSIKDHRQKDFQNRYGLTVAKADLDDVLATGRVVRRTWWERVDSDYTVEHEAPEPVYDGNMPTSHIVTDGIMSHNSDCRLQVTARSNINGKGMLDIETSVDGEGEDKYRYIHVRAVKNKLSTPYLEGMMRLWISDKDGRARGFDPFYDTAEYLKVTGQIVGKRNSMRFSGIPQLEGTRAFKWEELKAMIVGTKESKVKAQLKVGIEKPLDIRSYCKKQLADGDGFAKFFASMKVSKKEVDE